MVVVVGIGAGIAGIAQLHLQSNVDAGISLQNGEKQSQCARNEQDSFHVLGLTERATDCEKEPVTTNAARGGKGLPPSFLNDLGLSFLFTKNVAGYGAKQSNNRG